VSTLAAVYFIPYLSSSFVIFILDRFVQKLIELTEGLLAQVRTGRGARTLALLFPAGGTFLSAAGGLYICFCTTILEDYSSFV